ncbi:MAG TPA: endonuclease NucS domain-containing protein [Thermodesulfovibrionales bacterium]|nr:endonuclease NucS domain-containing protein [Thermodesulfovibrionales bacterium]
MTHIEPFSYNTYDFQKYGGGPVKKAPRDYVRVLQPGQPNQTLMHSTLKSRSVQKASLTPTSQRRPLAERNLEDFVLLQLEKIEPGLKLLKRQLGTTAGRLDILCQDHLGRYVVIELKREQGSDQVVGQILRYMGWVQENYNTDNVRGIIIVGKKDNALSYAIKAAPNILVKEFRLTIE